MQLVDSKLYSANRTEFRSTGIAPIAGPGYGSMGRGNGRNDLGLILRLKRSSASERLLALTLAEFVVTASPALLATVRSTVSLSLQILLQAGHAGLIAFQIFGR